MRKKNETSQEATASRQIGKDSKDLTILFATHNGAQVLRETLIGYTALIADNINWELIIVNNGSVDESASIIQEFIDLLPLKALTWSELGKNKALNSALPFIESNFVVITDDDAIPSETFLKGWLSTSLNATNFELFGGLISPSFTVSPPAWMENGRFHFPELFAERNLPEGPIDATEIYGPNMAVRTSVFNRGVIFNEEIGPNGGNVKYPMGSETEFCRRAQSTGCKAYFTTKTKVLHIVRPHQVEEKFWISRAYRHGLGFGAQSEAIFLRKSKLNKSLTIFKLLLGNQIRLALTPFCKDVLQKNNEKWEYNWHLGYIDALTMIC